MSKDFNELLLNEEVLKPNEVNETLFVGVGGIGSDIVLRVAQRCQDEEKKNIKFVAMDTDANELRNVKNGKANIIPVQTSSTQSVLDYLNSDKVAMQEWFPVNTTLYNKTVSEGAGQVRAISRLALNATIKSGNINALYGAIDDLFLKDGGDLKQALRVVIVSSVAGGTGSGIAMIVGMLIREYLHKHYREKAAIIRGYLLMPGVCDVFGPGESEKISLRRNGYATIKEINAFMMKASGFCMVRKDLERFKDIYVDVPTSTGEIERLEGLPFDFCFLLDKLDKSQSSMTSMEQYKEFAAQSLYEQNIGPMKKGSNSMEDNVIKEFANGDNLGRNRFGGIGASVIRYPYQAIADYVAYSQAIDRIGCSQSLKGVDNGLRGWIKYDRAFSQAILEYKKNRAFSAIQKPEIYDVYVDTVNNGNDEFDKDVKSYLSDDFSSIEALQEGVEFKINEFLDAYKEAIIETFEAKPSISDNLQSYKNLGSFNWESYKGSSLSVANDKATLDELKAEIDKHAESIAKNRARSILFNAPSIVGDVSKYSLEHLVKTNKGAMHPNAVRYMLYALLKRLKNIEADKERDSVKFYEDEQNDTAKKLLQYSSEYTPAPGTTSIFNVDGKFSKTDEVTLDDLCRTLDNDINSIKENQQTNSDFLKVVDACRQHLVSYHKLMMRYRNGKLLKTAYEELEKYITELLGQFENFYQGFESKAFSLKKKKTEIVDSLKFNKGDSVLNICGTEAQLDEIYDICKHNSTQILLPEELNAEIFDAVKRNAEVERTKAFDPRNAGLKKDIFDEVLIKYFRETVRVDYDGIINLNIIQAIKFQQTLEEAYKDKMISELDIEEYISNIIKKGTNLAAPGIGLGGFDADRMLLLCSYNKQLNNMLDIDVKEFLESVDVGSKKMRPEASESVSKYEMHFFSALYNITPDKLSRFKNPQDCEDSLAPDEEGIYYTAYHEYSKKIGPDSTKSGTISSHIDKRWDAIVEMPEISMNSQYAEMIRIHSSLIYGIVHGFIVVYPSSQIYDKDKKIFALEDEEGDINPLVVSNGTECDEFYEVIDALYRDNASVERIFAMAKERRRYDEEASRNYTDCGFVKDATNFSIGKSHAGTTSLFEIPLVYYNSLPKAKLDGNELSTMVDAVISVLEQEINRYEKEDDRKPLLAIRLQEQFALLVKNFNNDEYNKKYSLRKNTTIGENSVIRVVLKKLIRKIKDLDVSNANEKIDSLKKMVSGEAD